MPGSDRDRQLERSLRLVQDRIAAAAGAAGRSAEELTLVVVTKTYPAQDVRRLHALGVREVGESRDQEATAKAQQVPAPDLRWHMIGRLQSNKAGSVAGWAAMVHTVDRPKLVRALSAAVGRARDEGRDADLDVLLQVSLDGDPARGGTPAPGLGALAELVDAADGLRLRGLMAVAPVGLEPARAFAPLAGLLAGLAAGRVGVDVLSAGMSGDFEAAVAAGATHLRVGSAILGERPPLR